MNAPNRANVTKISCRWIVVGVAITLIQVVGAFNSMVIGKVLWLVVPAPFGVVAFYKGIKSKETPD